MTGLDAVEPFIVGSPLGRLLGMRAESLTADEVSVRLPFRDAVTTLGDMVHGGAIAAAIDVAATGVAWAGLASPEGARGTTVALTVNYVRAARGRDIVARARAVRRGRSIVVIEVDVTSDDEAVAKALVTYKLGA